jgi:hypothetical protein
VMPRWLPLNFPIQASPSLDFFSLADCAGLTSGWYVLSNMGEFCLQDNLL